MINITDEKYLNILLKRIAVCKEYKPKFGQGSKGVTLDEFQLLYGTDQLYAWFGLDSPLMYAAHKAAGGITSIYRQIGIGSEELFRQLLMDNLGLTREQASWSYEVTTSSGLVRVLKLDGRIEPQHIMDAQRKAIVEQWINKAAAHLGLESNIKSAINGIVLEVRQGYKSKDSKRQNADIANAATAYTRGYIPVLVLLSTQIDMDVVERYERGKWLVLRGVMLDDNLISSYAFVKNVIGYDLVAFFERNALKLREFTVDVLESLLRADDD